MVAKKKAKSLKSKDMTLKGVLTTPIQMTAVSTVGVGEGWGVTSTRELYRLADLLATLRFSTISNEGFAEIVATYMRDMGEKHNL